MGGGKSNRCREKGKGPCRYRVKERWTGKDTTHHLANRTLNGLLATDAARAPRNHVEDGGLLEAVRALAAGDGVLVGKEGEGALDADAFAGNGQVVVVVFVAVGAGTAARVGGWEQGRVGGEPGRRVGKRRRVVAWVQGVVHDSLEADVGVVGRVAVGGSRELDG